MHHDKESRLGVLLVFPIKGFQSKYIVYYACAITIILIFIKNIYALIHLKMFKTYIWY